MDVDPDSTLAQEEIFGPVLSVIPYEDDDDAVRIANNSRYGLSGAVNGTDLDRAYGIAKRLRTGTVAVNGGQWFGPDSPFGGYKESGLGREHGIAGLRGVPRDQDDRPAAAGLARYWTGFVATKTVQPAGGVESERSKP